MEKMSKYNGMPKDFLWGGALAANQMERMERGRQGLVPGRHQPQPV
mgnify:CR=1 FL=1